MEKYLPYAVLLLRISLAFTMLAAVADKLGYWGEPGTAGVLWGDWDAYIDYVAKLLPYLSGGLAEKAGTVSTLIELMLALMLLFGLKVRWAAIGTAAYTFVTAALMLLSQGPKIPLNYSLFVVLAAALLLACCPIYKFTLHGVKKRSTYHPY
ncbi:DoxX family protein [Pontibacter burrus]|uniref:DoxX family protein n=1 Tax=Pontibacter burrus TaxID=2704466 RepID=A0A6B3LU56_9BACT|nr:DoxX family protein [Pontibacter burrus]NEM97001.1 DoxX family protein [Pontibacter burrus]